MKRLTLILLLTVSAGSWAASAMDNQRLGGLIDKLGDDVNGREGYWHFLVEGFPVTVITDERANRMRIIVPVVSSKDIDPALLKRLLQANFDSALDARYSIAKGVLWSAFIHPLGNLSEEQFIDGLAQTVNLAATFGATYSSGALIFGGGDSKRQQQDYYQRIKERALSI